MKRFFIFLTATIFIIAIDQLTKWLVKNSFHHNETKVIIDGLFNLTYIRNPGAAFGFLANAHDAIRKPFLFILPVGACVFLLLLFKQVWKKNIILEIAYTLIFAGAVGNLIDRFFMNYVVDFLDFYFKEHHFPAFNVADSSISIAVGFLFWDLLIVSRKRVQVLRQESEDVPDDGFE